MHVDHRLRRQFLHLTGTALVLPGGVMGYRAFQPNRRIETQSVIGASGAGTCTVDVSPGPSWLVRQISISSTSVLNTTAATYIGRNTSGVFISSTLLGNSDTDSIPNTVVRTGDALSCVWAGGTPGALIRMTVVYDEVAY